MISEFKGDFRFLSNFWPSQVVLDGEAYPTIEHAFQAAKTQDKGWRTKIRTAGGAGVAKRLGREIPKDLFNPNWNEVRVEVMADLLMQKFYNEDLRDLLLATENEELIEGNTWNDTYWGVCRGEGVNKLGQLLMAVRQFYRVIDGNSKYEASLKERLATGPLPVQ